MIERIVNLTDGVVGAIDMHMVRLAWLKANRPEKFPQDADRVSTAGLDGGPSQSRPVISDFCAGRAEVARRSHKPEVAGSNPAPATTHTHTRESEKGREGVPLGVLPMPPLPEKPPP